MANTENTGFIEKYIEKIVLGVCVVLLLYGVMHWVVGSPRVVELDSGVELAPSETDAHLLRQAEGVRRRHDQAVPEIYVPSDALDRIEIARKGPSHSRGFVLVGPGRPALDNSLGPDKDPIKVTLANLQDQLQAPSIPHGLATKEMLEPEAKPQDVNIVRWVSWYDFAAALKAWKDQCKDEVPIALMRAVAVECEIMAKSPDGRWDQAEIIPIKTARKPYEDTDADGNVVMRTDIPEIPTYTVGGDRMAIAAARDKLIDMQQRILQPDYWWNQDSTGQLRDWRESLPQKPLEDIGAPLVDIEPRGLRTTGSSRRRTTRTPTARERATTPRRRPTNTGRPTGDRASSGRSGGVASRSGRPTGTRSPSGPSGPGARSRDVGGLSSRRPTRPTKPTDRSPSRDARGRIDRQPAEPKTPQVRQVPEFRSQVAGGKVLVWVHYPSAEPGMSYKARFRIKFLNPLLMRETDLKDENRKDAFQTAVATPWSAWSDVVKVPQETEMFLTSSIRPMSGGLMSGKVGVTVFTRVLGQTVENNFTLTRGQAIGVSKITKTVVNNKFEAGSEEPAKADPIKRVEVDFFTGAVVVDIDFNKRVLRNGISQKTVEMKYLDRSGVLHRSILIRHMPPDSEQHERYNKLKESADKVAEAIIASKPE